MTKFLPFVYDETGIVTNQKCYILSGEKLKFLTGLFNSKLWKFSFKNRFPELLGETFELSKVFFDKIPIKKPDTVYEERISQWVDEIISAKKANQNSADAERKLNLLICRMYQLTLEEAQLIDPTISQTEFDAV